MCISSPSLGEILIHPVKWRVNDKTFCKRWEWLKSSFGKKQGFMFWVVLLFAFIKFPSVGFNVQTPPTPPHIKG